MNDMIRFLELPFLTGLGGVGSSCGLENRSAENLGQQKCVAQLQSAVFVAVTNYCTRRVLAL